MTGCRILEVAVASKRHERTGQSSFIITVFKFSPLNILILQIEKKKQLPGQTLKIKFTIQESVCLHNAI